MKNIQPFIDVGWHTVPLGGELQRLPNGKKTIPIFPRNWNVEFVANKNTQATNIGGVITGESSGIIAIDCDNTLTYSIFKTLDPEYNFHFISDGKKDMMGVEQQAGTIIYKYTPELPESYKVHNAFMSMDFLSNGGFTYLPTKDNSSKILLDSLPELKEVPTAIIALIQQLKPQIQPQLAHQFDVARKKFSLAPQVTQFVDSGKVARALFKIITPKDFRDEVQYQTQGYLHPANIPDGRGSEYLSKVSAIFGADPSIDEELYSNAMVALNEAFKEPMGKARLFGTVIEPMIDGKASIDGKPIWYLDVNAQAGLYTFITKNDDTYYAFYDDIRQLHYIIDLANEMITSFNKSTDIINHISTIGLEQLNKKEFQQQVPLVRVKTSPADDFGFYTDELTGMDFCNSFISTSAYKVFKNPEEYAAKYKRPNITISFIETLIPDNAMRHYLLGFLRRKLDTFEYSPVILYFLGASGAGKDTLVRLLSAIIGENSLARPTADVFMEKHNGWLLDKYFIQLDEFGNQLSSYKDKEKVLGLLKTYTGSSVANIRAMTTDGYAYNHSFTFILTANKNPLMLDHDDRRVALFKCPTPLQQVDWVHNNGGIEQVIRAIEHNEVLDFVYYLKTEIKNIDSKTYTTPPVSKDKDEMMLDALPLAHKIATYLKQGKWELFMELIYDYGEINMIAQANSDALLSADLGDLYEAITNKSNGSTVMHRAMKEARFKFVRSTTKHNQHTWKYEIPGLRAITDIKSALEVEE